MSVPDTVRTGRLSEGLFLEVPDMGISFERCKREAE